MAQRSTAGNEKGLKQNIRGKVRPDGDVARWLSTDYGVEKKSRFCEIARPVGRYFCESWRCPCVLSM